MNRQHVDKFRRLLAHLPSRADPILKVLKGHVLIEELMNAIIEQRLQNPSALSDDLSCHQSICLAEALCGDEIESWIWTAARKLNAIRNDIAHGPLTADVDGRLDDFTSFVEKHYAYTAEQFEDHGRLAVAITMLHLYLSELLRSTPEVKLFLVGAKATDSKR